MRVDHVVVARRLPGHNGAGWAELAVLPPSNPGLQSLLSGPNR